MDERSFHSHAVIQGDHIFVHLNGITYCFHKPDLDECMVTTEKESNKSDDYKWKIKAPMPGRILRINVNVDDAVNEGQCLAIVEAMKMETDLIARCNGLVKTILKHVDDQVDAGEIILELKPETE